MARNLGLTAFVSALIVFFSLQARSQMEPPKRALDMKETAALSAPLRRHCDAHFPATVQELSKTSCYLGLALFAESSEEKATSECAKLTQPQSRSALACRLGVQIAADVASKRDTFTARMQLCQDYYPQNSEADAFLQEACWVGVTLAFHTKLDPMKKPKTSLCSQFSEERAFFGPCAVGLSLASESQIPTQRTTPGEQNKLCLQYFDRSQFHQGYRGCMNARALALDWNQKASSLPSACSNLTSGKNDDVERAACVVGGSIWHNLAKTPNGANLRFRHCGDRKVNWTEKEFLACLTAAALLDLTSEPEARQSCKLIFSAGGRRNKNTRRNDCFRAVESLAERGVPPAPTTVSALPVLPPLKTDVDDPDLWPEAPDTPEEEAEANEAPASEEGALNATEEQRPNDKSTSELDPEVSRIPGSEYPQAE